MDLDKEREEKREILEKYYKTKKELKIIKNQFIHDEISKRNSSVHTSQSGVFAYHT